LKREKKRFEAKPLSFTKYFLNNPKRSMSMILALAVSVMMIVVFQMIAHVVIQSGKFSIASRLERTTVIYPGEKGIISEEVLKSVKNNQEVDKLVPILTETSDYYHFFGNFNIPIYIIGEDDLEYVLKGLDLKLKEGRYPEPGKNEILLDWRTANNKSKKLGDFIGREVDSDERMPGKYKIVGLLDGDSLIGFYPIESNKLLLNNGILVFTKPGRLDVFNSSFEDISLEEAKFYTLEYAKSVFEESEKTLGMLTSVVAIAILCVMAFAAGNASYAQYFSRRYEFGILQSIGYSKAKILIKAAKEIGITSVIGMIVGLLASFLVGVGIIRVYFESKGYPFILVNVDGLMQIFVVPICTAVFSLIPSAWILSKVDPMMIIEKFE